MKHRTIRSRVARDIRTLLTGRVELPHELHDFQIGAVQATYDWLRDLSPTASHRAYIEHATGLGKTVLFAAMICVLQKIKVVVIVPNKTLLVQTARVLAEWTEGSLGHLSSLGNVRDLNGDLIAVRGHKGENLLITTDESFKSRSKEIAHDFDPQLIVWDECHWGYSEASQAALENFPETLIIGFTATPDYLGPSKKNGYIPVTLENGQVLYGPRDRLASTHFGTCLDRRTVRWGIENRFLAPLAWGLIEFDKISLDDVPIVMGAGGLDYKESDLRKKLRKHWSMMTETICRLYRHDDYNLSERQTYAVCPSVDDAMELAEALEQIGIPSASIHGDTPDSERDRILQAFSRHEIRFISSVMVLREGWDAPNAEVAMMLRPTKSRLFYAQGMGRVLRLTKNRRRKIALVLDAHFLHTKLSPLLAPMLFGDPVQGRRTFDDGDLISCFPLADAEDLESPFLPKKARPRIHIIEALEIEHWADESGFIELSGELWGSIRALAQKFSLSERAIAARTGSSRSCSGRDRKGRQGVFYALTDVKEACADLIDTTRPRSGKNGCVTADDEVWGTRGGLCKTLGLAAPTIVPYLKKARSRHGIDHGGRAVTLYALADIQTACAHLLNKARLQVGSDGIATAGGETWGMVVAFREILNLACGTISARLHSCRSLPGRDRQGKPVTVYALSDVKKACADLLDRSNLRIGTNGFVKNNKKKLGTSDAHARLLGISAATVIRRMRRYRSYRGLGSAGHAAVLYALADVKKACADLLKKKRKPKKR